MNSNADVGNDHWNGDVQLRQIPYPYRAVLAICSDLDGTPDRHTYLETMRFLNTTETTVMGSGVGLEVGNTIHFCTTPRTFSYWNTDDEGREMVRSLIRSGHIECLHSFGELAHTRKQAEEALSELKAHDCQLSVWVDHGNASTNFGSDIMDGHGDEIGHSAYHADLTIHYGIKYIWCGRITSITGQDIPPRFRGIFNRNHPFASGKTLLKEATKQVLAWVGNKRYAMHGPNEILRPIELRDGKPVYEFMRCNPHWGGVSCCDEGRYIGEVLTDKFLSRLVKRGGTCILYTHLGRVDDPAIPFNTKAVAAFRRLAEEFQSGRILVTTTRRLLDYRRAIRELDFNTQVHENILHINLSTRTSKKWNGELHFADLSGLTFYVQDPQSTSLTVNGQEVADLKHNPPDQTGRPSVSVSWSYLEFPKI